MREIALRAGGLEVIADSAARAFVQRFDQAQKLFGAVDGQQSALEGEESFWFGFER